jgi:hypothetical protein
MSIINALDNHTPKNTGENGNQEYTWSNNFKEMFSQFYFQLVRTKETTNLENILRKMLNEFKQTENTKFGNMLKYEKEMIYLYKLIAHTRDVKEGKGEYNLSYMQLYVWYDFFPDLTKSALKLFVDMDNEHPYGSWKDIKYFAEYVKEKSGDENHELIMYCIELITNQINKDLIELENDKKHKVISLAGKWCPREKGRFSWLFKKIINVVYKDFYEKARKSNSKETIIKAHNKACMLMNRKITKLNKYLDTTQIKMCEKQWTDIDFNHVTSKTLAKNRKAFLNDKNKLDIDRIKCAENLKVHLNKVISGDKTAKLHGKRESVYELVRDALRTHKQDEIDIINEQWKDNASQNHGLKNIIPIADTSGSMTTDKSIPLYNSIGLSIRISELAEEPFHNRIMTFSSKPQWVRLNDNQSFVEKVKIVSCSNWSMDTNFYAAMKMILDSALEAKLTPEQICNLTLAVFSDMQINVASYENMDTMMEKIEKMYHMAGMNSIWKTPCKPPHILFWNLRKTNGFPSLSTKNNVSMLSGYSSILLNVFCNKGFEELKTFSPHRMICDILSNKRYDAMREIITRKFFV